MTMIVVRIRIALVYRLLCEVVQSYALAVYKTRKADQTLWS